MVCSFEFECKAFINLPHEMKGARACVHDMSTQMCVEGMYGLLTYLKQGRYVISNRSDQVSTYTLYE